MAPRKKVAPTPVVVENDGPTQNEIGHLISSALNICSNNIVSSILEKSEDLEISREQIKKIQDLVKDCTSKTTNSTLNHLISLY
mgnify:CR=1 FL=1|tara:strand:+ start:1702 stop:1953 length:252 start_codon:yes stop_codon:yes gene_type:complete